MKVFCAWCGEEVRRIEDREGPDSHGGICLPCVVEYFPDLAPGVLEGKMGKKEVKESKSLEVGLLAFTLALAAVSALLFWVTL